MPKDLANVHHRLSMPSPGLHKIGECQCRDGIAINGSDLGGHVDDLDKVE